MYVIMYELWPCFHAALVSHKGCDHFLLMLPFSSFQTAFQGSQIVLNTLNTLW
jgi:hypothetical protein